MESVRDKVKLFMEQHFLFSFDESIQETSDLFQMGLIDSFGYLQLLKFIESEFAIQIEEEEALANLMVSYHDIVAFVITKMAGQTNKEIV